MRGISFKSGRQFMRIDSMPLTLRGGCPPGELREGSAKIAGPSFRVSLREKISIFREHFMRLGNMDHRRNRQTTQFRQKSAHTHRRPHATLLSRRIGDNRAGLVRKQRTAEVIEQMRQGGTHRMIVFRTHHDIAVCRRDFVRQGLELGGCLALRVSKEGFEYRSEIKIQRIDQLH